MNDRRSKLSCRARSASEEADHAPRPTTLLILRAWKMSLERTLCPGELSSCFISSSYVPSAEPMSGDSFAHKTSDKQSCTHRYTDELIFSTVGCKYRQRQACRNDAFLRRFPDNGHGVHWSFSSPLPPSLDNIGAPAPQSNSRIWQP